MNDIVKIKVNGRLLNEGSTQGKTVGPLGMQQECMCPSKSGIIGINDSADPEYEKKLEIARLLSQYNDLVAKGRYWGKDVAADMLEHWLKGGGSDKKLDYNWLRGYESITDAEDINKKRFEEKTIAGVISRINEGQILEKKGYWDRRLTAIPFRELYYASGTSIITSRGLFKFNRKNNWITIAGAVEHHWWDPYDWHPGLTAYIPGFGSVADEDAKKLEDAGYGQSFGMYSLWHQYFSGKYGIDKGIAFFDDSKYTWGSINPGRAPKGVSGIWSVNHDAVTDSNNVPLPGVLESTNESSLSNNLEAPVPRRNRRRRERDGWR